MKNLLIKKLNKHLDGEVHSVVDLSMRDTTGDRGSLCGLAAVYQAGKDTILSISQLKKMSFDDVKSALAAELGLDPTTVKGTNDIELLESFYSCKCETVCCLLVVCLLMMFARVLCEVSACSDLPHCSPLQSAGAGDTGGDCGEDLRLPAELSVRASQEVLRARAGGVLPGEEHDV